MKRFPTFSPTYCSKGSNILAVAQTYRWLIQRTEQPDWAEVITCSSDLQGQGYILKVQWAGPGLVRWPRCHGGLHQVRRLARQQPGDVFRGCHHSDGWEVLHNLPETESQGLLISCQIIKSSVRTTKSYCPVISWNEERCDLQWNHLVPHVILQIIDRVKGSLSFLIWNIKKIAYFVHKIWKSSVKEP